MAPRILPILSTLDDIAEAIADPPSRRPFAKAVGEAGRKICDRRSANPGAAGYGGALGAAVDTMCGPYWEENDYSPPSELPPFSGGQCEGTVYSVDGQFVPEGGNPSFPSFFSGAIVNGPVTGVETRPRAGQPGKVDIWITSGVGPDVRVVQDTFSGLTGLRITSVTRVSGNPDVCGDPPGDPIPGPNPAPDPGPIPPEEDVYDDPETGPMLPIPGLPGVPFRNPFGGGGASDPPGDPGEPGDAVPADGIGGGAGAADAEGSAPPGSELVGLRLDLASVLPNFPEYGDGIYRGGAYIYMGKVSGLDQDFGGSQIRDGQFFYAETPGQTKWRVTANVGISWLVTPFYREVN